MPWHDDVAAKLPGPHDADECALRQDIVDELADHLECAFRRELRTSNNEHKAREAALARFGNPARIAYRLWFDALKGRIMSQRIMLITNVLLLVVVIGLSLALVSMMRKNESIMAAMLVRMEEMRLAGAAETPSDWTHLDVKILIAGTNQPASGVDVHLKGPAFGGNEDESLHGVSDDAGKLKFGPIHTGKYQLTLSNEDVNVTHYVLLYPGTKEMLTAYWPDLSHTAESVTLIPRIHESDGADIGLLRLEFKRSIPGWDATPSHGWLWIRPITLLVDRDGVNIRRVPELVQSMEYSLDFTGSPTIELGADFTYQLSAMTPFIRHPERASYVYDQKWLAAHDEAGEMTYSVRTAESNEWFIPMPDGTNANFLPAGRRNRALRSGAEP